MAEYCLFNKPLGCVTAVRDSHCPTVMDYLPEGLRDRLHPVGRLDKNTEGLLLLTDDGELDAWVLRPEHHIEKTYFFMAFGLLEEEAFQRMAQGVILSGSGHQTLPADCRRIAYQTIGESAAYLPDDRREHYLKNPSRPVTVGEIKIREGHKHQVRLMVKAVGGFVFFLRRTAIGALSISRVPKPGQWVMLGEEELSALGYQPGKHSTMRKFDVCQAGADGESHLGTFYYGKRLTYLPVRPASQYPDDLRREFGQPYLLVTELPSLQNRIREGDRHRQTMDKIIRLPGDNLLLRRCGRVTDIDWETLTPYQQSFRTEWARRKETSV